MELYGAGFLEEVREKEREREKIGCVTKDGRQRGRPAASYSRATEVMAGLWEEPRVFCAPARLGPPSVPNDLEQPRRAAAAALFLLNSDGPVVVVVTTTIRKFMGWIVRVTRKHPAIIQSPAPFISLSSYALAGYGARPGFC